MKTTPFRILGVYLALLAALCLGGCALDQSYRAVPGKDLPAAANCNGGSSATLSSFEICAHAPGKEYLVGYVEFDDQGWFHNPHQKNDLLRRLRERHERGEQFLIVVFAHGWKHNALGDDENVGEFRDLLKELDFNEQALFDEKRAKKRRTVVGVYLGWRGASITAPLLEELTFWTRKNAAERIGERSAKQLLMELNQFRVYANDWDETDNLAKLNDTQVVFIGHSFGGLLMYRALQTELMERALQIHKNRRYRTAKSFGDFILLVNPAFEGAAFEPLWEAARTRKCYPNRQRPIMAIVTSKTDRATKWAFPFGRLYTLAQSAPREGERETVLNTVGHLDRYRTHTLTAKTSESTSKASAKKLLESVEEAKERLSALERLPNIATGTERIDFDGGTLIGEGNPGIAGFPYLVVAADDKMIDGHSQIWEPRFRNFMRDFIVKQVMEPPDEGTGSCNDRAYD